MTSHAFTLAKFYKDMGDVDPDFRQTGLWDLTRELERNGAKMTFADADQEKLVQIAIKSLNEKENHSDVHANAIQALVHLTPKIKEAFRVPLIKDLARCVHGNVKADDPRFPLQTARIASLRDNAGIALKNIVESCDSYGEVKTGEDVLKAIVPANFNSIADTKTKSEILDVASTVIKQFGSAISHEQYKSSFDAARTTVDAKDWGLRRRALLVVAQLSLYIPQDDFNAVLDDVIKGLSGKGDTFRNRAQLASAISQRAGSRFAAKVTDVVKLLSKGLAALEDDDSPQSDDIRENILHAYEHITVQCAGSISGDLLNTVASDAVKMLDWDPNFAADEFDDEDVPPAAGGGEVYDGMVCREGTVTSFDEVIDESDDSSWKVRRAAAHSLAQIIRARPDVVGEESLFVKLFKAGNPVFLTRLRDRVESVQQEASGLLQVIFEVSVSNGQLKLLALRANPLIRTLLGALKGSVSRMQPNIGAACFANIRTALSIFPGVEWQIIVKASEALQRAFHSASFSSPVLKPEAMRAAGAVISNVCDSPKSCQPAEISAVFGPIFKFIFDSVADKSIKTASSAIASTSVVARVAKLFPAQVPDLLKQTFQCLEASLAKPDVDLEVKRASIDASCNLLTAASAELGAAVPDVAPRFVKVTIELCHNDALRSAALPLLALCASKLSLPADAVTQIVAESTGLLKKADRQVREGALRCLNGVLAHHSKAVGDAQAAEIVKVTAAVPNLLSENELYLAVLCLTMLRSAVAHSKAAASALAKSSLLGDALSLAKAALQQATHEIAALLAALVKTDSSLVGTVLKAALEMAENTSEARVLPHVAQVLAAIVAADIQNNDGKGGAKEHLDKLVDSNGGNKPYAIPLFGELGRNTSLEKSSPKALALLQQKMQKGTDEEKTLASTALGRVASSPHNSSILNQLLASLAGSTEESVNYFNLRAIREAVNSAVHDAHQNEQAGAAASNAGVLILADADTKIARPLLALSATLAATDDSVTIPLVSECLGRAALLLPEKVVPMLIVALGAADAKESTALCVASAMRFVVLASSSRAALRPLLVEKLASILHDGLANPSHRVRRASLLLLVTSLQLIGACTFDVKSDIGLLLNLCKVDKALQVSIDVGLFVHVKDAGLEMRRAAFEALAALCLPTQVGTAGSGSAKVVPVTLTSESVAVVTTVANALGLSKDETEPELQIAARSILLKLADIPSFASEIFAQIEKIAEALRLTIVAKVKDGADADAVRDNARSAALAALKLAPRAVHSVKLAEAIKALGTSTLLAAEKDTLIARAKEE